MNFGITYTNDITKINRKSVTNAGHNFTKFISQLVTHVLLHEISDMSYRKVHYAKIMFIVYMQE